VGTEKKKYDHPGQPRKYMPDDLEQKFMEYLEWCAEVKRPVPNIAGFCRYADINKDTYYNYRNMDEYSEHIKRIENALEDETINCKDTIRSLFHLKAKFGYKETQDINIKTEFTIRRAHV
jgi:hypothetical protein